MYVQGPTALASKHHCADECGGWQGPLISTLPTSLALPSPHLAQTPMTLVSKHHSADVYETHNCVAGKQLGEVEVEVRVQRMLGLPRRAMAGARGRGARCSLLCVTSHPRLHGMASKQSGGLQLAEQRLSRGCGAGTCRARQSNMLTSAVSVRMRDAQTAASASTR